MDTLAARVARRHSRQDIRQLSSPSTSSSSEVESASTKIEDRRGEEKRIPLDNVHLRRLLDEGTRALRD